MKYRKFGKLDWEVSALGLGCMRLPMLDGESLTSPIIEEDAIDLIHYSIDNGINYLDTAYLYHGGNSELMLGKALKGGYRDKVKIATKSPMMQIKTVDDYNSILDAQLKKLGVDHIDFYLFHGLNSRSWQIVKDQDLIAQAEAAKKAGKIGHIGFSFHDGYPIFEDIVKSYDAWEFCQIQYNFIDEDFQAGRKGLQLAASRGIGVVVMEPLRGGKLANPIKEVSDFLTDENYEGTLADLSLQWLWDQEEVSVVLSGMSTIDQAKQNIESANKSAIGSFGGKVALTNRIKEIYEGRKGIPCTRCSYCMPCPQSVNIPMALNLYNEGVMYDYFSESKRGYNLFGKPARACISCKECESKCPQQIPISEWMSKIDGMLADDK